MASIPLSQMPTWFQLVQVWSTKFSFDPDVELLDLRAVAVNLNQGQFLAKSVALSFISAEVDRLFVDERVIEAIELLLNRFSLDARRSPPRSRPSPCGRAIRGAVIP